MIFQTTPMIKAQTIDAAMQRGRRMRSEAFLNFFTAPRTVFFKRK